MALENRKWKYEEKSPYISPLAETVCPASFLCGNSYDDENEDGLIGFGSGELDASMDEAKTGGYEDFEGEEAPDFETSLWEE